MKVYVVLSSEDGCIKGVVSSKNEAERVVKFLEDYAEWGPGSVCIESYDLDDWSKDASYKKWKNDLRMEKTNDR